jgi:hypothetical protein
MNNAIATARDNRRGGDRAGCLRAENGVFVIIRAIYTNW